MRKPSLDTLIKRFRVIVDSREQLPYKFSESITQGLSYGDYTIFYDGRSYEDKIIVERKSRVGELYSATGKERLRFERELEKLSVVNVKCVICEFSFMDIVNKPPPGKLEASSVYGSIAKWQVVYGVPFLFLENRNNARAYLYKLFYEYTKYWILDFTDKKDEIDSL